MKRCFLMIMGLIFIALSPLYCADFDRIGESVALELRQPIAASPTPEIRNRTEFLRKLPQGGIVAEIGVQRGVLSEMILDRCNPKELYLIDCWEEQENAIYMEEKGGNVNQKRQKQLYHKVKKKFGKDSRVKIIKAYSPAASAAFSDEFFDWVYLDANHAYWAVKLDLEAWFAKVKPGGYLCGHDYATSQKSSCPFGVIPAVNEFVKNHNLKIELLSIEGNPSYAIRKPSTSPK